MAEVWKDIIGYEGLYQVSNLGNIRSFRNNRWGLSKTPKILRPCIGSHGYFVSGILGRILVHKLVAQVFIPNPHNKRTINHKDGNKLNNNVSNLEWATDGENNLHAYRILKRKPFQKSVGQYTLDGTLIKVWDSLTHASQSVGVKKQNIFSCCNNYRGRVTSGGYKRQYI